MPIPQGRHTDWPWPFSYIPREWTAIPSNEPPHAIATSDDYEGNLDIPQPGHWALSQGPYGSMFAWTGAGGLHFRIGLARYDYVDHYYQLPTLALKRIIF